jgi:hypothetical protein
VKADAEVQQAEAKPAAVDAEAEEEPEMAAAAVKAAEESEGVEWQMQAARIELMCSRKAERHLQLCGLA